jgi:hypothetical protein
MTLDPKVTNQLQQQGRKIEREVGRTNVPAVLGDGQGNVSLPGNSNWYYYREVYSSDANGTVYSAPSIALAAGKNLPEESGTEIIISFWGEIAVVDGIDPIRYSANGKNARALNPQSAYNKFVLMEYAVIGYAVPVGTQTTPTMEVYIKPFYYVNEDGDYKTAGDAQVDLTSKIPAAVGGLDQHVIVGLFLKSDNTFELVSSTPKLKTDTLTHTTDVVEVFAGASARAMPIRTWRVYTGQTLLSITDEFSDIRLWLPTMRRKHNFTATVAPTANDDIDLNYEVGSWWFDVTNDVISGCVDSSDGAAVWNEMAIEGYSTFINIDDTDSPYTAGVETNIIADTTSGNITINLPAVANNAKKQYTIKNVGTGSVTLDPNASETIDGSTTLIINTQYDAVKILCDGIDWWIM